MTTIRTQHTPHPALGAGAIEPIPRHAGERADLPRYNLIALAAEAVQDRIYDESAKVRVTQEDIRKLLAHHRKERK